MGDNVESLVSSSSSELDDEVDESSDSDSSSESDVDFSKARKSKKKAVKATVLGKFKYVINIFVLFFIHMVCLVLTLCF